MWIRASGREDLAVHSSETLHKNYRICSEHFEEDMFFNEEKLRLLPLSVPKQYCHMNISSKFIFLIHQCKNCFLSLVRLLKD